MRVRPVLLLRTSRPRPAAVRRNVCGHVAERIPASGERRATAPAARSSLRQLLPRGGEGAVVAFVGAALAGASLARFGLDGRALIGVVLCPVLVLLTAIDLRHRLLPNVVVLPAAVAVAAIVAISEPGRIPAHAAAGAAYAGVLLLAALLVPAGLGMGDVKLALLIGVALGAQTVPAVFVSSLASLTVAVVLIAREGRSALKRTIAFGPYLALGAVVAYFLW
jgi:leader peptidase (prepilin peptidase)/N-methyltransferase